MYYAIVFGSLTFVAACSLLYFWTRVHKFSYFQKVGQNNKIKSWLLSLLPILAAMLFGMWKTIITIIVLLHLFVIWLLSDMVSFLIKKITKKNWVRYWQGVFAIVFTAVYLCAAWYLAHHVYETNYTVCSEKKTSVENFRAAYFADSHIGATFDGEGFAKHLKTIQKTNPDVLVIVGDFVDDGTTAEDMKKSCKALGDFQAEYGVYFVYGNHDKGYTGGRGFTKKDLDKELKKNNVTILRDRAVELTDGIVLLGRKDKGSKSRTPMSRLAEKVEKEKFTILLDHQPNDYEEEAKSQVDLVLSGHTHGGWLFPVTILNRYIGPDDMIYGMEKRKDTTFIVTSGISDWSLPFKTGTISEFVVVDICFQ